MLLLVPYLLILWNIILIYKHLFKYIFLIFDIFFFDYEVPQIFVFGYKNCKRLLYLLCYDPFFVYIPRLYFKILEALSFITFFKLLFNIILLFVDFVIYIFKKLVSLIYYLDQFDVVISNVRSYFSNRRSMKAYKKEKKREVRLQRKLY
jgi:hypothetical protein